MTNPGDTILYLKLEDNYGRVVEHSMHIQVLSEELIKITDSVLPSEPTAILKLTSFAIKDPNNIYSATNPNGKCVFDVNFAFDSTSDVTAQFTITGPVCHNDIIPATQLGLSETYTWTSPMMTKAGQYTLTITLTNKENLRRTASVNFTVHQAPAN